VRPVFFLSIEIFMLEISKKHGIFLIGWLGILMNLRLVNLLPPPHPPAFLIIHLLHVRSAIVLTMTVFLVPIIFLLMVLLEFLV